MAAAIAKRRRRRRRRRHTLAAALAAPSPLPLPHTQAAWRRATLPRAAAAATVAAAAIARHGPSVRPSDSERSVGVASDDLDFCAPLE